MEKYNDPEDARLTSGSHISYWVDSVQRPLFTSLKEDLKADVVIVGGGLGGLSVAYCLTQKGKNVVLVEDGFIGSGETGRTTAHLASAIDDRYYEVEKVFGKEKTALVAESHAAAIDFIEQTAAKENIDCDFERLSGYLFLHPSDEPKSLTQEFAAAKRAGLDVKELPAIPSIINYPGNCIEFANQAQFHPMKYLNGLCKAIVAKGGKIYTETHATKIDHEGITTADGFKVKVDHVVIATNSPVNDKYAMHNIQYAYRSYVIGALVKKGQLPRALWWDTGNFDINSTTPPYHYVRLQSYNDEYDLLICGGEDHTTGDTTMGKVDEQHRYFLLESWTRKHFPIGEIVYRWSGQVMEPTDMLGFIGRNPYDKDNVYIVTGDSGNGMTHCTIAGMLITDLILGHENKWEDVYSPRRIMLKATPSLFKEMISHYLSYLKDIPHSKDNVELESIKDDEGKVVTIAGKRCGVYRDETGRLHIVSADCTHLHCTVHWNNDERSWDCPCHGSRFTYDGKVINGPANYDLPVYTEQRVLAEEAK